MLKALIRTGLLAGAAYGAYYAARRYFGSDFDQAVDKVKNTARDIGKDFLEKDETVSSSFKSAARKSS